MTSTKKSINESINSLFMDGLRYSAYKAWITLSVENNANAPFADFISDRKKEIQGTIDNYLDSNVPLPEHFSRGEHNWFPSDASCQEWRSFDERLSSESRIANTGHGYLVQINKIALIDDAGGYMTFDSVDKAISAAEDEILNQGVIGNMVGSESVARHANR